jgi:hypothetical protein
MQTDNHLKRTLEAAMRKRGIGITDVIKKSGMSVSGFYRSLNQETIRFDVLCSVCELLQISVAAFDPNHENYGDVFLYQRDKVANLSDRDLLTWEHEAAAHCGLMQKDLLTRETEREKKKFPGFQHL